GRATERATPPPCESPDRGGAEKAVLKRGAVAQLLVGAGVGAVPALEARVARRLPRLHAAEEGLIRPIQPGEYILQHLGVDVAVFGPYLLDLRQLGALDGKGATDATLLPCLAALLQGGVIEFPAAAHDKRQHLLLRRGGLEFVLEGLAYGQLLHLCPTLALDVLANRLLADIARCAQEERARPQRWQLEQMREFRAQ